MLLDYSIHVHIAVIQSFPAALFSMSTPLKTDPKGLVRDKVSKCTARMFKPLRCRNPPAFCGLPQLGFHSPEPQLPSLCLQAGD